MYTIRHVDAEMKTRLAPLLADHHRVDFAIESIMEGQRGKQIQVVVDDLANPNLLLLRYGTFGILAGDARGSSAEQLLTSIDLPCAIQPSPQAWIDLLYNIFPGKVKKIERFSFSSDHIDSNHLKEIINSHPLGNAVQQIDTPIAEAMQHHEWNKYHLVNYNLPEEFAQYGSAYGICINSVLASACSAALRCTRGIEMNIITLPEYRNKGLALVVAAQTIINTMEQQLIPHWDAANEKSANLAIRLGYKSVGSYYTHYIIA